MSEKRITIKDVAHEAGMSVTTISCILNGHPGYSESTRKKVWDLAIRMNYKPDPHARSMRGGTPLAKRGNNHLILHVLHLESDMVLNDEDVFINHALLSCLDQLVSFEAMKKNYYVTRCWYYQRNGFRCPPLLNGVVDGILLGLPHKSVFEMLHGKIPVVLMDINRPEFSNAPAVNTDFLFGFTDAFQHLHLLGYRKIAFIYTPPSDDADLVISNDIGPLISTIARQCGLTILDEYSYHDPVSYATHEIVTEKMAMRLVTPIREKKIDLIVTLHSDFARTIRRILEREGIRIPEDIGLFTKTDAFHFAEDGIASVGTNWREMVPCALNLLISQIEDEKKFNNCSSVRPLFFYEKTIRNKTIQ